MPIPQLSKPENKDNLLLKSLCTYIISAKISHFLLLAGIALGVATKKKKLLEMYLHQVESETGPGDLSSARNSQSG